MREIERQLISLMQDHKRTGSKASKQEEIDKLIRLVNWLCDTKAGVKRLEQIGRRHIFHYYEHLSEDLGLSISSIYKYQLAIEKLWLKMDRKGVAPKAIN